MTPTEQARVDAIHRSIEETVQKRREPTIPGLSVKPPNKTDTYLIYGAFFALVLAVHLAGFLIYREIKSNLEAARVAAELDAKSREITPALEPVPTFPVQPPVQNAVWRQALQPPAQTPRRLDSNPVPATPAREERPHHVAPASFQPPAPPIKIQFTSEQHAAAARVWAYEYFNGDYKRKIGSRYTGAFPVTVEETTYDPNWQIYRTSGSVTIFYDNIGRFQQKTVKYEAVTQVKNDKIVLESEVREK